MISSLALKAAPFQIFIFRICFACLPAGRDFAI
jgi:hypothetical protein